MHIIYLELKWMWGMAHDPVNDARAASVVQDYN